MSKTIQRNDGILQFGSVSSMRSFTGGAGLKNEETVYLFDADNPGFWEWSTSSSAADDGVDVVKITGWVGNGRFLRLQPNAANSQYNQGGTGAEDQTQKFRNQRFVLSTDFMTAAERTDVISNTGSVDVSGALQYALNTGRDVLIVEGTHEIGSTILKATASGQRVYGLGWNCIIKTDEATLQFALAVPTGLQDVHIDNLKFLGAATSAESASLQNGAIGGNTTAAGTAFAMSYPETQNGRLRVTNCWFDNWHVGINNNSSDGLYACFNKFTRIKGLESSYGYGVNNSGKNATVVFNLFDNDQLSGYGKHDGSDNASTLSVSGKQWETDVFKGLILKNITDGSQGTITANTDTTITATLAGGTDDDWDEDDVFEVVGVYGSHDGSSNASTLTDSGESWTTDIFVGKSIKNQTDGSIGAITANTATTITATLSGGTDNDWDASDEYEIYGGWQGRHAVYLNGHSEQCTVVGNKAIGYGRNPFQFKAQNSPTSGYSHYIAGNLAKDSNRFENRRGAVYLFDAQTPLTSEGKCITFHGNKADNCKGEQLRMEYHKGSSIVDFKAFNASNHETQSHTNNPIILIYSDYTTLDAIEVSSVDADLVGIEVQQSNGVQITNALLNGSSYRSGVRWSAATPDTTQNCQVRGLTVEGTTSQGDVENAAGTSQNVQTNTHIGKSGMNVGRHIYVIASNVITVGYGRRVELAPESGTADDLQQIDGGETGQVISLTVQSGNTITIKDRVGGSDNLNLNGDFAMDDPSDCIVLENKGGNWSEISRSNNV